MLIVDYQSNIINEKEHGSDTSSLTDEEKEENSNDTSIYKTSLKIMPIGVLDGEYVDIHMYI